MTPRTALYSPAKEDLVEFGAHRGSPSGSSHFTEDPCKPMLSELGPSRVTSLVHADGMVDYIEDNGRWTAEFEQRVLREWVGQTEFLIADAELSEEHVAPLRDHSKLRRVRRSRKRPRNRATNGDEKGLSADAVPEDDSADAGGLLRPA